MTRPSALLLLSGLAALACFLPGCNKADASKGQGQGTAAVPVDVAAARLDSVQRTVQVVGTLFGEEDVTVSNKVNGKIIAIYKDVGDRVAPGEPLAQLLRNDYLLDVNAKQAELREVLAKLGLTELPADNFDVTTIPAVRRAHLQTVNAESRYNRGRLLHDKATPLISDQDIEDLKTALDVDRSAYDAEVLMARGLIGTARTKMAELLVAEQALRDTTVRAPSESYAAPQFNRKSVPEEPPAAPPEAPSTRPASASTQPTTSPARSDRSYVIAVRFGSEGELERAVTPLFRLVDDDPLKLRASVPERYFPEIAIGQKVTVSVEAYRPKTFAGVVTRINPQIDTGSRTFPIEIFVPNADHKLPPGAFAEANIDTRIEQNVVFVPEKRRVTFAGVEKLFIVKDGKAQEVLVTFGERRENEIEVKTGLKGGETVATSGTSRLATGVPVKVKSSPESQPASK